MLKESVKCVSRKFQKKIKIVSIKTAFFNIAQYYVINKSIMPHRILTIWCSLNVFGKLQNFKHVYIWCLSVRNLVLWKLTKICGISSKKTELSKVMAKNGFKNCEDEFLPPCQNSHKCKTLTIDGHGVQTILNSWLNRTVTVK